MIVLLYMILKQKERKKEIQQLFTGIVPLKGHLCTLFTPRSLIVVHIGTNVHLFEYKLQRCPSKGTIVYIFQILFCVCCMYSTWHTVMDTCTLTYYFILFYYTVIT